MMQPSLEIVMTHTLPNRVRLRFSHPLKNPDRTIRNIERHAGIRSIVYTAETTNLLVNFDPRQIALEELVIRASVAYSAEHGMAPATVKASQPTTALTELSVLAGLSLIAGHVLRLVAFKSHTFEAVQLLSGLGTSAAVLEHTYSDLKQTGRFHPEVLSVGYLLASIVRGTPLRGATIAWVMTFARHLLEPPAKEIKIEAEAIDPQCDDNQCEYEAKISNQPPAAVSTNLLARIPAFLIGIYRDMNSTFEDRIFKEIWQLSEDHGKVLEGIEDSRKGIRLHIVR